MCDLLFENITRVRFAVAHNSGTRTGTKMKTVLEPVNLKNNLNRKLNYKKVNFG